MADGTLYVVNINFDGGTYGEVIRADPSLVQDWIDAQFISEVDDRGERIIRVIGPRGGVHEYVDEEAEPVDVGAVRPVTEDDLNGA